MAWTIEYTGVSDLWYAPMFGFDGNGEAHIGYLLDNKLYHIWRHDGAWTAPEEVATVPEWDSSYVAYERDGSFDFAVKGNTIAFVWVDPIYYSGSGKCELHAAIATVGGSWSSSLVYTWEEIEIPWEGGGGSAWVTFENRGLGLDIDSGGILHVVTVSNGQYILSGNPYNRSVEYFTSSSWSPAVIVSGLWDPDGYFYRWFSRSTQIDNIYARIVYVDASDNVHTVWEQELKVGDTWGWAQCYAGSATGWSPENIRWSEEGGFGRLWSVAANSSGAPAVLTETAYGSNDIILFEKPWGTSEALPNWAWARGLQKVGSVYHIALPTDGSPYTLYYYSRIGGSWGNSRVTPDTWRAYDADLCFHPVTKLPWIAFDGVDPDSVYGIYVAYPGSAPSWWFMI